MSISLLQVLNRKHAVVKERYLSYGCRADRLQLMDYSGDAI
jgi:hypothetical protein